MWCALSRQSKVTNCTTNLRNARITLAMLKKVYLLCNIKQSNKTN